MFFYEEVSKIGKRLYNKRNHGLQQIMGTKTLWCQQVIVLGHFLSNSTLKDLHIFNDDKKDYGTLTLNLRTGYSYTYSFTEILRKSEKYWKDLRSGKIIENDDNIFNSCKVKKNDKKYIWHVKHFFKCKNQQEKTTVIHLQEHVLKRLQCIHVMQVYEIHVRRR